MEDELELLRQITTNDAEVGGNSLTNPQGRLQELTPEIRERHPVVNMSRKQNRMSGVTNFLANPEVQNTLMSFGRAFADNQPNEAGTILADAGQNFLQSQANQRALTAAEGDGPIAEPAGRFADPGLVAGLQEQRTMRQVAQQRLGLQEAQHEQAVKEFDKTIKIDQQMADLREKGVTSDIILGQARLNLDTETFNARKSQIENEFDLKKRVEEKNMEYMDFLMSQEAGDAQNFALRTQEFLETLNAQEQNYVNQLDTVQDLLEDYPDIEAFSSGSGSPIDRIGEAEAEFRNRPEASGTNQLRREAARLGISVSELLARDEVRNEIEREAANIRTKLGQTRSLAERVTAAQAARLGAGDGANPESEDAPGNERNPVQVNSVREARDFPVGTLFIFKGQVYEVTKEGPLQRNSIEE